MGQDNLRNTTIKGMGWSFTDGILSQGITFVVGIILARILSPEDYGEIAIVTIFVNVFNSIVDSGLSSALIRKKDADDIDFNTVFWSNLILSLLLFVVLFLCARPIATFFNLPHLVPLIQVMSIIIIINALSLIQRAILAKQIDFKTRTKVSVISAILSGVIGIGMAIKKCGVWSLVGQQISYQGFCSMLLWIFNDWRPHRKFSSTRFKELFGFGWKLLVSGLMEMVYNEIYKVIIGKFYTPSFLGQYTRANQLASLPSSNITAVTQRVSFPALSSIQDDKIRVKNAYKKIIKSTMLITFVLMLGIVGCAKNLVYVLLGQKWMQCVPMLQLICFDLMLYPLHASNLNMLKIYGRSDLYLKLEIVKKLLAVIPVTLGIFVNIYWMLVGSIIIGLLAYYLNAEFSGSYLNYGMFEQVKDVLPSFLLALGMSLVVYLVGLISLSPYAILPLQVMIGFFIVVAICEITKYDVYLEVKNIVLGVFIKIKQR